MVKNRPKEGVVAKRLNHREYKDNFCDLHPPLSWQEALNETSNCLFCFEAPCQTACPTNIDIAMFIRQISTNNTLGAAKTIFDRNIFGAMCARVCPVEILCEQACVRLEAVGRAVKIGALQRFACDIAIEENVQFYKREKDSGKKVAIIGAGPAGLSCAHRLALFGHQVEIFEAKNKPGGLNEYGIAAYKTTDNFAQKEIDYILSIGNISINYNQILGRDFTLTKLKENYDAIFLAIGLSRTNNLHIEGEEAQGVVDAIDFIADLRQANDFSEIPIGKDVVVIGGGMSAIDAAIQAKLLGAQNVTICYRRGAEKMGASEYEQNLALSKGVIIKHYYAPRKIKTKNGKVVEVEFDIVTEKNGELIKTGEKISLKADQIFKAIGQKLNTENLSGIKLKSGRILVDEEMRTSEKMIFAGGDCIFGGEDLTVTAAANGRDAAIAINKQLNAGGNNG